jgi:hypothetical protein
MPSHAPTPHSGDRHDTITEQFYYSEHFVKWRAAVSAYFDDPPMVEHVTEVPRAQGEF